MFGFFIVVSIVWLSAHVLTARFFWPRPVGTRGVRRTVLMILLALASLYTLVAQRMLTPAAAHYVHWIGWTYIGGFSTLFALLVVYRLVAWASFAYAARRARASTDAAPVSPERRAFLLRAGSSTTLGVSAALTTYGVREARRGPEVVEVEVPIRGLPREFDGYHIVQISDVHVGLTIDKDTILPIVETVTSLAADLVVLTGDLVDGSVADLRDEVSPLGYLRAPDGVLCVTGNHEYYSGVDDWVREFSRLGMRVLMNEHIVLKRRGASLVIAGVTDYGARSPALPSDPAGAIATAPVGAPRILLAHQPRSAYAASEAGYALQLSGHTHGGQFFPWNLVVGLVQPVSKGLAQINGMWVYVNRGTCYWGPPVRTGVPAEITSLRLRVA